jgi:hypothetical protein
MSRVGHAGRWLKLGQSPEGVLGRRSPPAHDEELVAVDHPWPQACIPAQQHSAPLLTDQGSDGAGADPNRFPGRARCG